MRGRSGAQRTAPPGPAGRRRPGAYLRGSRTWAPGSTCCQTGRCPPAPWQAPRAAAAERGEPARLGSCRDPDGKAVAPPPTDTRTHGHRARAASRPRRLAPPAAQRRPAPRGRSRLWAPGAPATPLAIGAGRPAPSQSRPRPPHDGGAAQSGPGAPAMLGLMAARQAGLDDPARLRRAERTRR